MKRITVEKITLVAQFLLTMVLFAGFFIAFYIAWFSSVVIDDGRLRIIDTMVGSLGTMTAMAAAYWFARQRNASADPDPEGEE